MKTELILLRGLPGSSKSTVARLFENFVHLESDMFFGDPYDFDSSKLFEAHNWCFLQTRSFIQNICSNNHYRGVVVSNTFTTLEELRPYFQLAKEFKITPNVILAQGNFKSIHGVPFDVLEMI